MIEESRRLLISLIKEHCKRFKIQELKITYNPVNGLTDLFLYDINHIENVENSLI